MMTTRLPSFVRRPARGLPVALLCATAPICAQIVVPEWALPAPYGDERPDFIMTGVGSVVVNGDVGAFQERTALTDDFFGGVEDFSLFRELGEDWDRVLKIRFRGMLGINEGELDVSYEKLETWKLTLFVDHHTRHFDAQTGEIGFFDTSFTAPDQVHDLDFGTIRFAAERSFEDLPTLRLRYTRRYRDGERSSTIWGQRGAERVNASTRVVEDTRDVIEVEAEQRTDSRHWRLTGQYAHTETEQTLRAVNDPVVNPARPLEQHESTESDSSSLHGFVRQELMEGLTASLGGLVTRLDANVSGYRQVANSSAFVDLTGDSELNQYVVNGNLAYRWSPSVDSVLGLSIRGEEIEAATSKNRGRPADMAESVEERDAVDLAFETRLHQSRYATFYVLLEGTSGDAVLSEEGDRISRRTDSELTTRRTALGFRLYPFKRTSLTGEFYRQSRDTDFVHERLDNSWPLYPGFITALEEEVDDANVRLTVRPSSRLHLVSRVDWQQRTLTPRFTAGQTAGATDVDRLTFSQNISFTPIPALLLQVMASWTENLHRTPLSEAGGELARILPESVNDHWSLQAGLYATLNEKTDLQATYTYFHANNFFDNRTVAVPFGVAEESHQLNVVLSRELTANVRALLRYGFYHGSELRTIDFNDYEAHLFYGSLHYRF